MRGVRVEKGPRIKRRGGTGTMHWNEKKGSFFRNGNANFLRKNSEKNFCLAALGEGKGEKREGGKGLKFNST